MVQSRYHVIGVMSGTSLDGVDLAEIFFTTSEEGQWTFELGACKTISYPKEMRKRLQEAVSYSSEALNMLNSDYTNLLSETLGNFIDQYTIENLHAICSHGHTVLHQPEQGITLQIGNKKELANALKICVVCDFRVQDVVLGGQGAPLVPIGDRLLFSDYEYCLNLGGFANVSFETKKGRIAYDVCPMNIVLNRYAETLGRPYDKGGSIAASGIVDESLLQQLNALAYYSKQAPKSLGLEWVQRNIMPLLETCSMSSKNILATFTEHIAMQLAFQFPEGVSVLVTGGGAYNDFLLNRVNAYCKKNVQLVLPPPEIIDFKEALIFGLLGVLRLRRDVNCLASVTGAKKDHSSGKIYT